MILPMKNFPTALPGAHARLRFACIAACICFRCFAAQPAGELPLAPGFVARDIDNRLVSTDSLIARGPLIIDFWATWCSPCMAEFKAIEKLVKKYADSNLTVVAVSEDGPSEAAKVRHKVAVKKWPFVVVIDNGGSIARKFNVTAMPSLFLIGRDGKVRLSTRGFVAGDEAKLEEAVRGHSTDN
jgi:thiol-disulfide isomerase/thioredoxin